jgi:hypothetical protein
MPSSGAWRRNCAGTSRRGGRAGRFANDSDGLSNVCYGQTDGDSFTLPQLGTSTPSGTSSLTPGVASGNNASLDFRAGTLSGGNTFATTPVSSLTQGGSSTSALLQQGQLPAGRSLFSLVSALMNSLSAATVNDVTPQSLAAAQEEVARRTERTPAAVRGKRETLGRSAGRRRRRRPGHPQPARAWRHPRGFAPGDARKNAGATRRLPRYHR